MAKYPIKMLKDEEGTPFVPLVSTEALRTPEGETITEPIPIAPPKLDMDIKERYKYALEEAPVMAYSQEEVCEFMRNNNITGIQMKPVTLEGKGHEIVSGLYQLCSEKVVPSEKIFIDETQKVGRCPICGSLKVLCKQDYQLQLIGSALDLSDDFYMTEAIFGEGISYPLYIISQKLYQLLVCAKMSQNVIFEPVVFSA